MLSPLLASPLNTWVGWYKGGGVEQECGEGDEGEKWGKEKGQEFSPLPLPQAMPLEKGCCRI